MPRSRSSSPCPPARSPPTRLPTRAPLFRGASVYTAWDETPRKTAILVKDGQVVSVGNEAEARAAAPGARVVDLAGAVLVPGLTDAHGHVRSLGALHRMIDCRGLSKEEILLRVRALSASAPKRTWIRGRAWDQNRWTDTAFPTAADLEPAAPKTPVVLGRVDGHAIWANAAALRAAGVTKATPDPPGGRIERLKDGSPGGRPRRQRDEPRVEGDPGSRARRDPQGHPRGPRGVREGGPHGRGRGLGLLPHRPRDLRGARAGREAPRARLRDGRPPELRRGARARPGHGGAVHAPRGEGLRGRRARVAGSGAPRGLLRRAREPRPRRHGARGDRDARREGVPRRVSGLDACDRRPREPHDARRLRKRARGREARRRAPAHRARAGDRAGRCGTLREARRDRVRRADARDVRLGLGGGPAREGARQGRVRLAHAPEGRGPARGRKRLPGRVRETRCSGSTPPSRGRRRTAGRRAAGGPRKGSGARRRCASSRPTPPSPSSPRSAAGGSSPASTRTSRSSTARSSPRGRPRARSSRRRS